MTLIRDSIAAMALMTAQFPAHSQSDPFLDRETITTAFQFPSTTSMDLVSGTVSCPDEAVLITGGAWIMSSNNGIPPHIALMGSRPLANSWTATAREMVNNETTTQGSSLLVSAVCGFATRSTSPHIEVVTANYTMNRSGGGLDVVSGTAACPAGKTVLSGGAKIVSPNGAIPENVMLMTSKFQGNGWWAVAREFAEAPSSSAVLSVSAVCADVQSGIGQLQAVSATVEMPNTNGMDLGSATVSCPSGKTRIGGGAEILSSNGGIPPYVSLLTSEPNGGNGWSALARETQNTPASTLSIRVTATASCAALSSEVRDLQVVTKTVSIPNRSGVLDAVTQFAYCPAGKTMIGGGAKILSSNGGIPPYRTLMSSSPSGNGWMGVAREAQDDTGNLAINLIVSAVCAVLPD